MASFGKNEIAEIERNEQYNLALPTGDVKLTLKMLKL